MDCKKICYWNFNGICCPESKEGIENAEPSITKMCPTFLRKDFEEHLWQTHDNIIFLLKKRNLGELEEIEEFVKSQREGAKVE